MKRDIRFPLWRKGVVAMAVFAAAPIFAATDAGEIDATVSPARDIDVVWHAGAIGVFDEESHDVFASIEGRWRCDWHGLRPWGGFTVSDAGVWFAGAGLIYDIRLSPKLRLTLGSGPFYYTHNRRDDDLGLSLEFYSFAEASWVWKDEIRLGLRIGHLSNAGLGRENPGTETVSFVVSASLERLIASSRNP